MSTSRPARSRPGRTPDARRREVEEKQAKSAAGKRGPPMPATAAKVLKAFQTLQKKERLKAGDVYVDSNHLKVAAEHLGSGLFG
ncbi:hypothetical protein ACLQ22_30400 [Micromonospora sp. DT178]|uniref:hypothetical protein n=1 Tax=Micromonospora sp. DT178 TaxID=3393436 RepID=UPI003CF94511